MRSLHGPKLNLLTVHITISLTNYGSYRYEKTVVEAPLQLGKKVHHACAMTQDEAYNGRPLDV